MDKRETIFLSLVRDAVRTGKAGEKTGALVRGLTEAELDGILTLAKLHHLGPMVGQLLYTLRPDWSRAADLRKSILFTGMDTARKSVALQRLTGALEEAGVAYCLVKGAVCRTLYPNPDLRISMDEDILVEDWPKAEAVFDRLDYSRLPIGSAEGPVHTWAGESGLRVELHKDLMEDWSFRGLDTKFLEDCLPRRTAMETAYGRLYTLPPQEHFLYLLLHFYKHFLTGGVGLRQLCDIMLFAEKYSKDLIWPEIWRFLAGGRLDVLFRNLVDICVAYLGMQEEWVPVPAGLEAADSEDLLADILAAGAYGSSTMERKRSSRITMEAVNTGNTGKSTVLRALFPRRADLVGQYSYLEKRPWLLPMAWGSRILGYVRSGGSHGAAASAEIGSARVALLKKYKIVE